MTNPHKFYKHPLKTPPKSNNHPFHMVTKSPWPILMSMSALSTLINMTLMMKGHTAAPMSALSITIICFWQWWRDVVRESYLQGSHTKKVMSSIKMGMVLFILSELLLFISLFWMLLHSSLSPSPEIGMMWPPPNITPFNPFDIPMLNSALLITSGMFLTWFHYELITNQAKNLMPMIISIMLGVVFTIIQAYEYMSAPFSMSDSIYGSAFFMMTGFHGAHVIIGITFMTVAASRMKMKQMSAKHHINFELSAWYWHFVDVVWIVLYLMLYM